VQNVDYEKVAGNVGYSMNVGPCHHGMARPHVADEKPSDMEGSCE
jgi:hypothetical protein